jgi:hypothetical protein
VNGYKYLAKPEPLPAAAIPRSTPVLGLARAATGHRPPARIEEARKRAYLGREAAAAFQTKRK